MKVCAIVVTYNPKISQFHDYLKNNMKQVSDIIIVDNSEDQSLKKKVSSLNMYENIEVISLNSNYGIAYAQNIGIHKAIEKNIYNFILFLDQDSMLSDDTVDTYLKYYKSLVALYKIACLGVGATKKLVNPSKGAVEVRQILSSGSFIPISVFDEVGFMDNKMFIDFVDYDWCWRASSQGYKIFSILEISLKHTEGEKVRYIFGRRIVLPSPVRHYYQYRNFFNLLDKKHVHYKWKVTMGFKMFFKIFIYLAICDKKISRLKYILYGIKDFLLGIEGKFQNS